MLKINEEHGKWERCYSCYADENLVRITVGLDDSNASGQSSLVLCPTCLAKLNENSKPFLQEA